MTSPLPHIHPAADRVARASAAPAGAAAQPVEGGLLQMTGPALILGPIGQHGLAAMPAPAFKVDVMRPGHGPRVARREPGGKIGRVG